MSDCRDPAIKLFGKTIPLSEGQPDSDPGGEEKDVCSGISNAEVEAPMSGAPEELDQNEPANSSGLNNSNEDGHQICSGDAKAEQDLAEADTSNEEKVLKKPDKILPCPRCNSMDTKFCYFNNYNVNQPRYFCKNCQRYWTAGGSMRNVPVGAGRRKSKHSAPHQRHVMMMPDGLPCTSLDTPDAALQEALSGGSSALMKPSKENVAVQNFCPEAPLSEPMASVLNLGEQKRITEMGSCGENKNQQTCASSVTSSHHVEDNGTGIPVQSGQNTTQGFHNGLGPMHLPCYPGPPFVFPWSPGYNNAAAMAVGRCSSDVFNGLGNGAPSPVPWSPTQIFAAAPFCSPPTLAFPFMPAAFWGCMPSWPTGAWNAPWVGSPSLSIRNSDSSRIDRPILGKHSRDGGLGGKEDKETKSLWVPKTLRIDDPDEAAKSSIWATLGIKPGGSIKKGGNGMFKAFQSRTEAKEQTTDATQIRHANPAAMCRSQTFQESTV